MFLSEHFQNLWTFCAMNLKLKSTKWFAAESIQSMKVSLEFDSLSAFSLQRSSAQCYDNHSTNTDEFFVSTDTRALKFHYTRS